ncbi:hypothetical protein V1291_000143 [Nitrobacteraceae bacterium AZCC 1564]
MTMTEASREVGVVLRRRAIDNLGSTTMCGRRC